MSVDPIETSEAVPRGAIVERTGEMSRAFRNWLERGNRQQGKVISGIATLNSAVQVIQGQITEIDGSLSTYYGISVDGGGNGAILRLSDGASFGSAISLSADEITLDADAINFGSQTEFDTATETFITEVGGIRSRYGTAFGNVSSQVVMWHGPTSVAQGSESRTNGYLAIGTDGQIYHNTAALSWGATAAEAAASNARVTIGKNICFNPSFRDAAAAGGSGVVPFGWENFATSDGTGNYSYGTVGSGFIADYQITGERSIFVYQGDAEAAGYIYDWRASSSPCQSGDRVIVSAFTGAHRCSVVIFMAMLNSSGTEVRHIYGGAEAENVQEKLGGSTVEAWKRLYVAATVEPGEVAFRLIMRKYQTATGGDSWMMITRPMLEIGSPDQQLPSPYNGADNLDGLRPGQKGADVTSSNTAAAIAGQGVFATGNYYEQSSDPGSVPNGSFWFKTGTNELYVRRSGSWGKVATIANQNITITRTNGFVKTRIGAGTITSDSVSFSSTGGSGTGYTYAHELFPTYTTGPTPTISSASGSPITASASGAVPGDEVRGFVQTTVTDSAGNKATLLSPVALFCES